MKNFIQTLSELNDIKYSKTMNELFTKKIPCGFFCGFNAPQWVIDNALGLKHSGLNLQCICVLNESYRDKFRSDDVPVLTYQEFIKLESKPQFMLYIESSLDQAFCEFFRQFGLKTLNINNMGEVNDKYDEVFRHLEEIFEVYQMFDDESKAVYRACLKARISNSTDFYRYAVEPQYFLEPFLPSKGDVVIDGGAL